MTKNNDDTYYPAPDQVLRHIESKYKEGTFTIAEVASGMGTSSLYLRDLFIIFGKCKLMVRLENATNSWPFDYRLEH